MDFLKVAFTLLLAGTMLGGCGDDGGGTDTSITVDGGGDTAPSDMCMTGDALFYAASVLDVGQADPTGDPSIVPGFNLDGIVSDGTDTEGCLHTDFTSPPPDNEPGVDNQLGPILSAVGSSLDVSGQLAENVLDGTLLILFEVLNVDDSMNDGCVTLNLYLGQLTGGAMTAVDADGDGIIDGGQTFDLNPESLGPGEAPLVSVQGQIVNGRLSAGPIDIMLNLPIEGGLLLNIRNAQVRMTFAGDNITSGVIGGALNVEETVTTIVAIDPDTIPEALARSVLNAQADLEPDDAMGGACTAVSVGLTFEGVPAVKGVVGAAAMP